MNKRSAKDLKLKIKGELPGKRKRERKSSKD
jgi:hypothetical protein